MEGQTSAANRRRASAGAGGGGGGAARSGAGRSWAAQSRPHLVGQGRWPGVEEVLARAPSSSHRLRQEVGREHGPSKRNVYG